MNKKTVQIENFQYNNSLSYLDSKYLLSEYISVTIKEIQKCIELIDSCKITYAVRDDTGNSEYPCIIEYMTKAQQVCTEIMDKIKKYALFIFRDNSNSYCIPALSLNIKAIGQSMLKLNSSILKLSEQYHQEKIVSVATELSKLTTIMIFIEVTAKSPKDDIYYHPPESPDWTLLKSVLRIQVIILL